jgi:hypothetical protein
MEEQKLLRNEYLKKVNSNFDNLKARFYEMSYFNNEYKSITQRLISKFPSLYILLNQNNKGIKNALINIRGYKAIKKNNLMDIGYYLKNYGDVRKSGVDPILHYMYHGFKEGRKPNAIFDGNYYLKTYLDVKNSNLNPLVHYSLYGLKEHRETFNPKKLKKKVDLKYVNDKGNTLKTNSKQNSEYSLILNSGLFNNQWYLKNNPDVAKAKINPLLHYIKYGSKENRNPNPYFDSKWYLKNNPDVAKAKINPLLHYIKYGISEGRKVYPALNETEKFIFELKRLNLNNKNKKRILYVIHKGGGGTPYTNEDLMRHIQNELDCYVLTSNTKEIKLWQYKNNNFIEIYSWHIKSKWSAKNFYNPEFRDIYFNVLKEIKIDIVHIRHLFKHTFDLPEVATSLGIPLIISFHDFYYICPSYHLLDENNNYCAGKCTPGQKQCYIGNELNDLPNLKIFVKKWRNVVKNILIKANVLITTSDIVKQIYSSVYPELSEKIKVIEHGRDFKPIDDITQFYEPPSTNKPIKILVPGNINIAKGGELIKNIKKEDKNSKLEFHFIGSLQSNLRLQNYGIYHGPYKREDFNKLVNDIKPSFIGIFSICPETYCHTLSEAWSCGVPVLTTKLGAQEERLNKTGGGWFIDHKNPLKAYKKIIKIANSPKEYNQVIKKIEKITFKSTEEMANEYKNIYSSHLTK